MKKLLFLILICASFQVITAQQKIDAEAERNTAVQERRSLLKEMIESKGAVNTESLLSVTDVGEPDSFGKNAKFLGTAATGTVYIYSSCDPAVLLTDLGLTLGP